MAILTGNPSNLMNNLKKGNAFTNYQMSSLTPTGQTGAQKTVGVTAATPEQNVKKPTNILAPKQVNTQPVPTNKTFTPQENTGLLAALSRQNTGSANPEDTKNLSYAQSKGWKAPVSPTASTIAPTVKPTDVSSKGILTSLVDTANQGSPVAQQASQGLIGTAQTNPATTGQAYTDYQTAIDELNALKSKMAEQTAGISSTGIPLEFQQGRQGILNQQYASQLEAAQQKVNQAQAAINQQVTGTQVQQAGFTGAGTLGQTGQGLQQTGLTSAAQLAQPVQVPYGTQYVSPQTGEAVGNMGADMNSMISYWADQIANNKASLADVPVTITGAPNLKTQLQQAIQTKNPNYNPSVQGAGQQTAANLTAQTNQLQATLNGAEANFSLLVNTANQGGVNNTSVPVLNTLINNAKFGLTSDTAVNNFRSTLATVRSQYAQILGGGTTTVDSQNRAQTAIPDNISLAALQSLEQQMKQEAQNRIAGNQQQINSLTSSSTSPTGSTSGAVKVGNSSFTQDANGNWIVVK